MPTNRTIVITEEQQKAIIEMMNVSPSVSEISAEEVNVQPFRYKDELNQSLWHGGKLDPKIRLRLLDLADDFIETLSLDWVQPEDIILTGSMANYNWNKYSDIDVHIIMDYSKIHENKDFVKSYIESKKEQWLTEHDELTIKGFPVEMYVEDSTDKSDPTGAYSLSKGEWIRKPSNAEDSGLNEKLIKEKAAKYITMIDDLCEEAEKEDDKHRCEVIGEKLENILHKLSLIRKMGLKTEKKEMSVGNILYKVIKHNGTIKKAWDTVNSCYDRVNSINEGIKKKENIGTWYRGFDGKLGEQKDHLLWLTDDIDYAKEYGNTIMEYKIDESKIKCVSVFDLEDEYYNYDWHPIEGIDEEKAKDLLKKGFNSYEFYAGDDCLCLCLWDNLPIVSKRIIKN